MNRVSGNGDGQDGQKISVGMAEDKGLVVLNIGKVMIGFPVLQALCIARDINNNALHMLSAEHYTGEEVKEDDGPELIL
jgi:hypothetical protein